MATITPAVNPNKLTGLGRWLVKTALPFVVAGLEDAFTDGVGQASPVSDVQWRRIVVRYSRATPATTAEDYATWGMDIVNMTGGNIDSSWTAGDYTAVDAALNELLTTLNAFVSNTHTLVDVQYYARSFNPDLVAGNPVPQYKTDPSTGRTKEIPRFSRSGPPLHILTKNLVGGSGAFTLPYQSAMSVTFRTATRKHWGRCYLPGLHSGEIQSANGRFATATITSVANAFAEFASDLGANDFYPMVAVTQQDGKSATALMSIKELVVDDVPDVIRRRRPKQPSQRIVGVATP